MSTWRKVLFAGAVVAAVGEALDSVSVGWVGLESAANWIIQTAFLLLGLIGVVAACVTLWESRRAEAPPMHETG